MDGALAIHYSLSIPAHPRSSPPAPATPPQVQEISLNDTDDEEGFDFREFALFLIFKNLTDELYLDGDRMAESLNAAARRAAGMPPAEATASGQDVRRVAESLLTGERG